MITLRVREYPGALSAGGIYTEIAEVHNLGCLGGLQLRRNDREIRGSERPVAREMPMTTAVKARGKQ